jgi:hypothetical protein
VSEPGKTTYFGYVCAGVLRSGALMDWAVLWEDQQYSREKYLSDEVITWDGEGEPTKHKVEIVRGEMNENDYIPYTISVPGFPDVAFINIDGRA